MRRPWMAVLLGLAVGAQRRPSDQTGPKMSPDGQPPASRGQNTQNAPSATEGFSGPLRRIPRGGWYDGPQKDGRARPRGTRPGSPWS